MEDLEEEIEEVIRTVDHRTGHHVIIHNPIADHVIMDIHMRHLVINMDNHVTVMEVVTDHLHGTSHDRHLEVVVVNMTEDRHNVEEVITEVNDVIDHRLLDIKIIVNIITGDKTEVVTGT